MRFTSWGCCGDRVYSLKTHFCERRSVKALGKQEAFVCNNQNIVRKSKLESEMATERDREEMVRRRKRERR